ncbi:MAG: hypothetical protein ACJ74O_05225 [Frankiaceae bacterium]
MAGEAHDQDDTYGRLGVYHDSRLMVVIPAPDDGSRIYVKASQFEPQGSAVEPPVVEVEMELSDDRYRHEAARGFWLRAAESVELATALTLGAKMCAEARDTT